MSGIATTIEPLNIKKGMSLSDAEFSKKVEMIKLMKKELGTTQKSTDVLRDCIDLGLTEWQNAYINKFGKSTYKEFKKAFEAAVEAGTISGEVQV